MSRYIAPKPLTGSFELATVSFFYRRAHLAMRTIDTLLASDCPTDTLHLFLVDRSPELVKIISQATRSSTRRIDLCCQEDDIDGNPYASHMNWAMERLHSVDCHHIAIIDGDFELHSLWYQKVRELMTVSRPNPKVRLFTAFNNCNGTGWRHATFKVECRDGITYGLKHNAGSGMLVADQETFFALGPLSDYDQDYSWIWRYQAQQLLVGTTIPSYAQHLGLWESSLSHDENRDSALDFQGDYLIAPSLCGIWRHERLGVFYVHLNGLISSYRVCQPETILGHVSPASKGTVRLTFAAESYILRTNDLDGPPFAFTTLDHPLLLFEKTDSSDCYLIGEFHSFHLYQWNQQYHAMAQWLEAIDLPMVPPDQLLDYKKSGLYFRAEKVETLKTAITQAYATSTMLIKENYRGFRLFLSQGKCLACSIDGRAQTLSENSPSPHANCQLHLQADSFQRLQRNIDRDFGIEGTLKNYLHGFKFLRRDNGCYAVAEHLRIADPESLPPHEFLCHRRQNHILPAETMEMAKRLARIVNTWRILEKLAHDKQWHSVALYGAASHTEALLRLLRDSPSSLTIPFLIDDGLAGENRWGLPVIPFSKTSSQHVDFVCVSSDYSERHILLRLSTARAIPVPVYGLYTGTLILPVNERSPVSPEGRP